MQLHLGKKPATYDSRDLLYREARPKSLPISLTDLPTTWGHGADFSSTDPPPKGWGMLGNGPQDDGSVDPSWAAAGGAGDCAWAGPAHEEMQAAHESGRKIPPFSSLTILKQYSEYCGYNLQTGAGDMGSDVREVLKWRQKKGLKSNSGHAYKIGAYYSLELGDWQSLREACYLFESVGLGFEFPESAMNQFNNGQTWSVVPGAQIDGGHYVPIVGHPWPGLWTCITWGRRQVMTWQFIQQYADELWCYIDFERYNRVTGKTAEGYQDVDLERYITEFPPSTQRNR